jgi:two-component system response regulator PilR (NtrC family)
MKHRILVVDDERALAKAVGIHLSNLGFEVVRAEELEEAEALLLHSEFAVILADLKLTRTHGAEGFELLSFIRKHCPFSQAILLTGHGSEEVRDEARRRGARAVLQKPLPLAELARIVKELAEESAA